MTYLFITIDLATKGQQTIALILAQFAVTNNLVDTFGTSFAKPIYMAQLLLVFLTTSLQFHHSVYGDDMLIPLISRYPKFTAFLISLSLFSNLSTCEEKFISDWSPSKQIKTEITEFEHPLNCIYFDPGHKNSQTARKPIAEELRNAILQLMEYRFCVSDFKSNYRLSETGQSV
ncbi:7805_t:CDS:2 [Scutellospora calospora]|uniref:7805_t:CDS:1 n=1 Tax=Scutellospora calospora TaxID=85575 RepID=A0ACA9LHT3_9GLOM|nr:7805_t:CDS:2 [Scutellospora calospora]